MHCCNINKSRRGGFFLVHLVRSADDSGVIIQRCGDASTYNRKMKVNTKPKAKQWLYLD